MARLATDLVSMRARRRLVGSVLVIVGAVGALGTGCSSSPSRSAAVSHTCTTPEAQTERSTPAPAPTVPQHRSFGAFALTGPATQQRFIQSFDTLEHQVCRRLDIAHAYLRWKYPFPTEAAQTFAQQGKSLLLSWTGTDTAKIASGSQDAAIRATARQIASLPAPVFLEFRWEMDRPNLRATVHNPATYIAAWDRVRRLFAAVGTPNVSWVWCPTAAGFTAGTAPAYYPGDKEVDWLCTDAYSLPAPGVPAYPSFGHVVRAFLNWSKLHDKPLMIGEFGIPRSDPALQRASWFDDARQVITASPRIKAVVYFDYDSAEPPTHWFTVGNDPNVLRAFRALMAAA